MKKLLCLLCVFFCLFSCSEDKEIPTENPPIDNPDPNEKPVTSDSLFYQLNVEGYELIAATQSGTSLFLQADTTFAFRCLYDSCKTDRLVAYCDSTGMVERIIIEDRVFDMLYHEDYKKMDILFSNEGKMEWIKDVENPLSTQSSRTTTGDVPYSAISVVSHLSYAVYTIINSYPLYMKKSIAGLVKYYSIPPVETETAIRWIVNILGEKFDENYIKQRYATIAIVMRDYSQWVMNELYGDAIPLTYTWVERMKNDSIRFRAYVNDVDSLKTDFRMGMYIESGAYTHRPFHKHNYKEDMETGFRHKKCTLMATYNGSMQYGFVSDTLPSGKKYKFRSFLVPLASSKYLNDMKCLIDYTRYGEIDYFYLFEAKANVVSTEEDKATLMLSTELDDYHKNFKLGVYYGTNPDLPENDRMKMEVDVQSLTSEHTGMINEEITLTGLEPKTTYYFMPFIQYDGNIVNRSLENVTNVTILDKDKIFMGEGGSFTTIVYPITKEAYSSDMKRLILQGSFDTSIDNITEYGICFHFEDVEFTINNSTKLFAEKHQEGNFEVVVPDLKLDTVYYYRSYIIVDGNVFYGEIRKIMISESIDEESKVLKVYKLTKIHNVILEYEIDGVYKYEGTRDVNGGQWLVLLKNGDYVFYYMESCIPFEFGVWYEWNDGNTYGNSKFSMKEKSENMICLFFKDFTYGDSTGELITECDSDVYYEYSNDTELIKNIEWCLKNKEMQKIEDALPW